MQTETEESLNQTTVEMKVEMKIEMKTEEMKVEMKTEDMKVEMKTEAVNPKMVDMDVKAEEMMNQTAVVMLDQVCRSNLIQTLIQI